MAPRSLLGSGSRARRALLGLTTTALIAGGGIVSAPASADEAPTARADAAADWLKSQLTDDGIAYNKQFDFDDLGLTLDFVLAFEELDVRAGARERSLDALETRVGDYVGTGGETYAAQLGKLLTAVQRNGIEPAQYAGGKLVGRLGTLVIRKGRQAGRAVDASQFGNYTNTIGQSFVVEAFARDDHQLTGLTTSFLLKQQCNAGFFREGMDSADFTCQTGRATGVSDPSVDATAFAITALKAARRSGVDGLTGDIREGLRWLRDHQNDNGSFTGNGVPNANSTGLAATVLHHSRYDGAADRAAEWLRRRQVSGKDARTSAFGRSAVGAVAYNGATFKQGAADGITVETRDQWRRATAQAAAGLDALQPDR